MKKLKKKYPHIKEDFLGKLKGINFKEEIHIGRSIYKIRIKSSDQNKGKSGGFRSYMYFYVKRDMLVPLYIHAKSDLETLSENEIQHHFDKVNEELIAMFP